MRPAPVSHDLRKACARWARRLSKCLSACGCLESTSRSREVDVGRSTGTHRTADRGPSGECCSTLDVRVSGDGHGSCGHLSLAGYPHSLTLWSRVDRRTRDQKAEWGRPAKEPLRDLDTEERSTELGSRSDLPHNALGLPRSTHYLLSVCTRHLLCMSSSLSAPPAQARHVDACLSESHDCSAQSLSLIHI